MTVLIAKNKRAAHKITHHGPVVVLVESDRTFRGEPASLFRHIDTDCLRWVIQNDPEFEVGRSFE